MRNEKREITNAPRMQLTTAAPKVASPGGGSKGAPKVASPACPLRIPLVFSKSDDTAWSCLFLTFFSSFCFTKRGALSSGVQMDFTDDNCIALAGAIRDAAGSKTCQAWNPNSPRAFEDECVKALLNIKDRDPTFPFALISDNIPALVNGGKTFLEENKLDEPTANFVATPVYEWSQRCLSRDRMTLVNAEPGPRETVARYNFDMARRVDRLLVIFYSWAATLEK